LAGCAGTTAAHTSARRTTKGTAMLEIIKPRKVEPPKTETIETIETIELDTVTGGCTRCGCNLPNGSCAFERQLPAIWAR
jgi:hypothetical protein